MGGGFIKGMRSSGFTEGMEIDGLMKCIVIRIVYSSVKLVKTTEELGLL